MKYLLLLVCLAGCGGRTFEQTVISTSAALKFNATVQAIERNTPPHQVVVVLLENGGLYSLMEPFDKTDAGPLEVGQQITVEYVKKFKTDFQKGRVFQTTPADPSFEITKVTSK